MHLNAKFVFIKKSNFDISNAYFSETPTNKRKLKEVNEENEVNEALVKSLHDFERIENEENENGFEEKKKEEPLEEEEEAMDPDEWICDGCTFKNKMPDYRCKSILIFSII